MPSNIYDPSTWTSETFGGIPYRLMEGFPKLTFLEDGMSATEEYLIRTTDLQLFAIESFPPAAQFGDLLLKAPNRQMPGVFGLLTKEVSAEPFPGDRPMDPFFVADDSNPPTFAPLTKVTIAYEVKANSAESDETDPESFLVHSITAGGEYLTIPPDTVQSKDKAAPADRDGDGHPDTSNPDGSPIEIKDEPAADLKKLNVPITKIVPTIEHSLEWSKCPVPPWGHLRYAMGKVNSDQIPLFFNAPAETVLFLGFSAKQEWTWDGRKPWTLSMKFSERAIVEKGYRMTWNHFWIPGKGKNHFEVLYTDPPANTLTVYESTPFGDIFKADRPHDRAALARVVAAGLPVPGAPFAGP